MEPGQTARKGSIPLAAIGAGLYWGASMHVLSGLGQPGSISISPAGQLIECSSYISQLIIVSLALLMTVFARHLRNTWPFRALALAAIAANLIPSAFSLLGIITTGREPSVFLSILQGTGMAACVTLWGLRFASLNKREAASEIVFVTCIGFLSFYLMLLFDNLLGSTFDQFCFAFSLVCFVLTDCPIHKIPRDIQWDRVPEIIGFYITRALTGLLLGLSNALCDSHQTAVVPWPILAIVILGISLFVARQLRVKTDGLVFTSFLPIVSIGLFIIPCDGRAGSSAFSSVSTAIIWFAWIALSSFQLSEYKDRFGMDEVSLSCSEKAVIMSCWSLGSLLGQTSIGYFGSEAMHRSADLLGPVVCYGFGLMCAYAMWKIAHAREHARIISEALIPEQQRRDKIYETIAQEYGLTEREREVLSLLAEGHSRAYIQDALCVSNGTAKAHTAHIYQKLDVHKREELISLVESTRKRQDHIDI